MNSKLFAAFAILTVFAPLPVLAEPDISIELHQCRNPSNFIEKIAHCSFVIAHSRNRTQLEVAYNTRGFAFMEAERFIHATNDFTAVIGS